MRFNAIDFHCSPPPPLSSIPQPRPDRIHARLDMSSKFKYVRCWQKKGRLYGSTGANLYAEVS